MKFFIIIIILITIIIIITVIIIIINNKNNNNNNNNKNNNNNDNNNNNNNNNHVVVWQVSSDAREIEESKSILDELETQYKSLFQKYESLIQNKNKRLSQTMQTDDENAEDRAMRRRLAHKEVQTLLHMTLNRDYFQESCQPPPYKALFKDLFATLRKTSIDENPEQDKGAITPGDTPITSPSMEFSKVAEGLSELSKGLTSPVAAPTTSLAQSLAARTGGGEKAKGKAKKASSAAGSDCGQGAATTATPNPMKEEVYES